MTFQPGANLYTQGFGSRPENVEVPHLDTRAPTSTDIGGPIPFTVGKTWIDQVGNAAYTLTSLSTVANVTSATWVTTGGGSGALATLTADSGSTVAPSAGNIKIAGTTNEITTTGSAATVTLSIPSTFVAPGSITATSGSITATNGNLHLATAGNKLLIATGANASLGTATLTSGTVTVATTAVTASSEIFVSYNTLTSVVACSLSAPVASISAGVHFVINSQDTTDSTSTVNWWIVN